METICNFLTDNKDCLGLGLSLINTIAVIIIACVQNKMQRKQTKMQEYEHYYDIYCFVNSIYYALNGVKQNILNNIFSGLPSDVKIKRLNDYKGTIERLRAQLYATEMEFNLKVKTEFNFYIYDDALECAEKIIKIMFPSGEYNRYYDDLMDIAVFKALKYAYTDPQKTIEELKKAREYAKTFDDLFMHTPTTVPYNSPYFDLLDYDSADMLVYGPLEENKRMDNFNWWLTAVHFDALRERSDFQELLSH